MRVVGEKNSGETYNLIASIIALFMPNWKLYRLFFDTSKNLALSLSLSRCLELNMQRKCRVEISNLWVRATAHHAHDIPFDGQHWHTHTKLKPNQTVDLFKYRVTWCSMRMFQNGYRPQVGLEATIICNFWAELWTARQTFLLQPNSC